MPPAHQNRNFANFTSWKNGDFPRYIPIFRYVWLKNIFRKKNLKNIVFDDSFVVE